MPPGLSLREQIYADMKTTLATITTTGGYATTIGTVTRGSLSPLETDTLPTASLLPVSDEPAYGVGVNRWRITCVVRVWIDTVLAETASTLEALIADVQEAMQVDSRRGGVAELTMDGPVQYLYLQSTETVAGADVGFVVDYKTTLATPRESV